MADKNIVPVKTAAPNEPVEYTYTSLASSDKVIIPCDFKDEFTQIHFLGGSGAATVTIKAGNGYSGVNDEVFEVGAGKYKAMTIDSSRFMNISGGDKGNVIISVSAACSIAVVEARI